MELEDNLMCSICTELFIEPTVLNCGHMFCKTCIDHWKTKKKICPMCRTKITCCVQVFNLDSIIDKNVALLSSEAKQYREELINARKKVPTKHCKKKNKKSARVLPYEYLPRVMNIPESNGNGVLRVAPVRNQPEATAAFVINDENNLEDPFRWTRPASRRLSPSQNVQLQTSPIEAIDLTNVYQTPVRHTRSHTVTSTSTSGFIDLTNITP